MLPDVGVDRLASGQRQPVQELVGREAEDHEPPALSLHRDRLGLPGQGEEVLTQPREERVRWARLLPVGDVHDVRDQAPEGEVMAPEDQILLHLEPQLGLLVGRSWGRGRLRPGAHPRRARLHGRRPVTGNLLRRTIPRSRLILFRVLDFSDSLP